MCSLPRQGVISWLRWRRYGGSGSVIMCRFRLFLGQCVAYTDRWGKDMVGQCDKWRNIPQMVWNKIESLSNLWNIWDSVKLREVERIRWDSVTTERTSSRCGGQNWISVKVMKYLGQCVANQERWGEDMVGQCDKWRDILQMVGDRIESLSNLWNIWDSV